MKGHRASWLGPWLLAAGLVVMPAVSTTVRAQPGYGADPFWPYNSQYAPYVRPMGPASPAAGQGGAVMPRAGIFGANQFQGYLEGLQPEDRRSSDRASIGMPYYRAVDPSFDPEGNRQYRPNARANASFEQTQRAVADKYLAYYSERDPARRAELAKEYRAARRQATLSYSGRSRAPSRMVEPSSRPEAGSRRGAAAAPSPSSPATTRTRPRTDRYGVAPEIPSVASPRSPTSPRRATPSEVLNRSRAMDNSDPLAPNPRPSGPRPRSRRTEKPASSRTPSGPSVP